MTARIVFALGSAIALSACNTSVGGPPLVSGRTPPAAFATSSEPQPANSLPPGAQGVGKGPTATAPNLGSITIPVPIAY